MPSMAELKATAPSTIFFRSLTLRRSKYFMGTSLCNFSTMHHGDGDEIDVRPRGLAGPTRRLIDGLERPGLSPRPISSPLRFCSQRRKCARSRSLTAGLAGWKKCTVTVTPKNDVARHVGFKDVRQPDSRTLPSDSQGGLPLTGVSYGLSGMGKVHHYRNPHRNPLLF